MKLLGFSSWNVFTGSLRGGGAARFLEHLAGRRVRNHPPALNLRDLLPLPSSTSSDHIIPEASDLANCLCIKLHARLLNHLIYAHSSHAHGRGHRGDGRIPLGNEPFSAIRAIAAQTFATAIQAGLAHAAASTRSEGGVVGLEEEAEGRQRPFAKR